MSLDEASETRNEPARDERWSGANGENFRRFETLEIGRDLGELVEQIFDAAEITATRLRHRDPARQSPEKLDPQPIFENLDQPTHRIGRNIELGASGLEPAPAGRRFKCSNSVERWQSTTIAQRTFSKSLKPFRSILCKLSPIF